MEDQKEFRLSNQFVEAVMLGLQKCIMEQKDMGELLKTWTIVETDEGLAVKDLVASRSPVLIGGK